MQCEHVLLHFTQQDVHILKKVTTKCQQDTEPYLTTENPTPRHKIMRSQMPVVVLLMECITLNEVWNILMGFASLLEIGNT